MTTKSQNVLSPLIPTQPTAPTPSIDLGALNKFGSSAYATPNFDINARNDKIIAGLGAGATDINQIKSYL